MSLILVLLPLLGGALAGLWVLSRALDLGSPAWFKSWLRVWFGAGLAWACVMSALGAMASARALGWVEGPLGRLLFAAIILLFNPAVTGAVIGALAWWRWGLVDRSLDQQGARVEATALDVQRRGYLSGAAYVHSHEALIEYTWAGRAWRGVAQLSAARAASVMGEGGFGEVELLPPHPAIFRVVGERWTTAGLKFFSIVCALLGAMSAALFAWVALSPA